MIRFIVLISAAICLSILVVSCDNNSSPVEPDINRNVSVEITGLDSILVGHEGDLHALALEAVVNDLAGRPVPGTPVAMWIKSGPGYTASNDHETDSTGVLAALFYVTLPLGDALTTIAATAGSDTARASLALQVLPPRKQVDFTEKKKLIPARFCLLQKTPVTVKVIDTFELPVAGVPVEFSILEGDAEIDPTAVTDSAGLASVALRVNGRWFGSGSILATISEPEIPQAIDDEILEAVPKRYLKRFIPQTDDQRYATLDIEVQLSRPLKLDFITPDITIEKLSGEQQVPVQVALQEFEPSGDEPARSIPAESVSWRCNSGIASIQEESVTDEEGMATATLTLTGELGMTVVESRFEPLNLTSSITLTVVESDAYNASIELIDPGPVVWAHTTNSAMVAVRSPDGGPVVDIPVKLVSALGVAQEQVVHTDRSGNAILPYDPVRGGAETLAAEIDRELNPTSAIEFRVYQDPVRLIGNPQIARDDNVILAFQLRDTLDQPVPEQEVLFQSSPGELSSELIRTDSEGRGKLVITGGFGRGNLIAHWRRHSKTWQIQFPPQRLGRFEYRMTPLTIHPYDTGEIDTSVFECWLQDVNGNRFASPASVRLRLMSHEPEFPEGCSWNRQGGMVVLNTEDGYATAVLHAGEQIGGKTILMSAWADGSHDTTTAMLSTFAVIAGPPFDLDVDVNDNGEFTEDSVWTIEVSARVWDRYRNPVAEDYPVFFTIENAEGEVLDTAYTEDHGIARLEIHYRSKDMFEVFTIRARIDTPNGPVVSSREHRYPLQDGALTLEVDPANWQFPNDGDQPEIQCRATLRDGLGNLIDNAPILFNSNRARFYWFNHSRNRMEQFYPDPARKRTGLVDEENDERPGEATVYLRGPESDFFLDHFSLEVTIQVNAAVDGYDEAAADPVFIYMTRQP